MKHEGQAFRDRAAEANKSLLVESEMPSETLKMLDVMSEWFQSFQSLIVAFVWTLTAGRLRGDWRQRYSLEEIAQNLLNFARWRFSEVISCIRAMKEEADYSGLNILGSSYLDSAIAAALFCRSIMPNVSASVESLPDEEKLLWGGLLDTFYDSEKILLEEALSALEIATSIEGQEDLFAAGFQNGAIGRQFFVTSSGHMGVGPPDMTYGDEVAILFGGSIPFAVRPLDPSGYFLLGGCYVHGVMYGEVLEKGQDGENAKLIELF